MSVGKLYSIPLVRTLSEHHWEAAMRDMIENNTKIEWAGSGGGYDYYLERKSTKTRTVRENTFRRGKLIFSVVAQLPQNCVCKKCVEVVGN